MKIGLVTDVFLFFMIADEDKRLNATYIISVARKLGCSVFLLPDDIMEVISLISCCPPVYYMFYYMGEEVHRDPVWLLRENNCVRLIY